MKDNLKFFVTVYKKHHNFRVFTKWKMTLTFQHTGRRPSLFNAMEDNLKHGRQPQCYFFLKMTSNFQPIKDNLILIYKIEEKTILGQNNF